MIPAEINKGQLRLICEILGVDPNIVYEINLTIKQVEIKVYVRNEAGFLVLGKDEMSFATAVYTIPVTEEKAEE